MRIVWANGAFLQLAQKQPHHAIKTLDDLIGKTTQAIWKLHDHHSVIQNDYTVKATNQAGYFNERLLPEGGDFRTSLRFPIPGKDGRAGFICAVSVHSDTEGFHGAAVEQHAAAE